jgi:hypothetical protein
MVVSFRPPHCVSDPERERDLFLAVAQSTLCNFQEIWITMAHIVYGPPDHRGAFHTIPPQIKQLLAEKMAEAKTDAALLEMPLPFAEALAVWQRSCAHMRLAADLTADPDRRQALLDVVAASERRMEERLALHRQRYEERKNGDAA